MPTRNEEANLARCLECLKDFPEIVVVDSGSTDGTVAIAEAHGARVVPFVWNGRFPKKRNWALRNVELQHPWVLFIDADEFVPAGFAQEVAAPLQAADAVGYWLNYRNTFLGRQLRFGDRFRKLALFRRDAGEYERIEDLNWSSLDMEVHEHPILNGRVGEIRTRIVHEDFKGMEAYLARHNAYSTWEAKRYLHLRRDGDGWAALTRRQRIKYRLLGSWLLGPSYFLAAYICKLGFLDGKAGLLLALHKMMYFLQIKAKIDELAAKREG